MSTDGSLKHSSTRQCAMDCLVIALAALLLALNYEIFILPNKFAPAGINGLATMVQYLFHFSIGYMSLLINVPLAVFAFLRIDREFAVKTFLFSVMFSIGMLVLQSDWIDLSRFVYDTPGGNSRVLAPIASGVLTGFVYGVVMRRNGSSGGTDVIARFFTRKYPDFSMSWIMFGMNSGVALISYFVYDYQIEPVILCILYSYLASRVSDDFLKGGKQALKFEVITTNAEELSHALIKGLRHSVTILPAKGGYTFKDRNLLICVVNKHQVTRFSEILSQYPDTFAYVSSVNETLGNFKKINR